MSSPNVMRRADLVMPEEDVKLLLEQGHCARLATTGADGWPYVLPMLFVWRDPHLYFHTSSALGHLAANLSHDSRVCMVIDEPGSVYGYGRFECDSSISYRSVMAFGTVHEVQDPAEKSLFCDELMRKYGGGITGRPQGFYPRLAHIDVRRIVVDRMSGKRIELPQPAARWPANDRTRSPDLPPGGP
ncbi:MAG: pyridoxamine 5'-phosphate oxidase family protein [Pseudomonadota bacterium]